MQDQNNPSQTMGFAPQSPGVSVNQSPSPAQNPQPSTEPPRKKKSPAKIIGIIVVVLLVIGAIGSCSDREAEEPEPKSAQVESSQSSDQSTESAEPTQSTSKAPEEEAPTADKKELRDAVSNLSIDDLSSFTDETAQAFETAYDAAESTLGNPNATQEEVNTAYSSLEDAYNALQIKPFDENDYAELVFKDVARNPDAFVGSLVKCSGNVLQVMETEDETDVRLATDGYYDDVVYVGFDPSILDVRVLEDDNITIYGTCLGLYTYTATLGQEISLPAILATKVVINE